MDTKIKQNKIQEKIRLDKSYNNYHKIIDKKLPYKFSYLDEWLLKKSKLLMKESERLAIELEESENIQRQRFKTYQRGTIIKVDFGIGIGSEISQVHFAIVLNNYDNPKNNVLTVVPLTSKKKKFNLYLGNLIYETLDNKLKIEPEVIKIIDKDIKEELTVEEEVTLNKLDTLLTYYGNYLKESYACCNLVTTISKERIFFPINEYDIIGNTKCSDEIIDKINEEIKKYFVYQNLTFDPK